MPSPFPGMDPYLEQHWGDIHSRLVLYACDQIQSRLPDELFARVEEYLAVEEEDEGRRGYYPDVKITERPDIGGGVAVAAPPISLAGIDPVIIPLPSEPPTLRSIRIYQEGGRVVTAIEVLSPSNKDARSAQEAYRRKRQDLLDGGVSVVEIDLLRDGDYMLLPARRLLPEECREPYRASVIRGWKQSEAAVYRVPLRQPLPAIGIPLRQTDADIRLDLQPLIDACYENGRYSRTIHYREEAVPPLRGEDAAWADALLRERGKR